MSSDDFDCGVCLWYVCVIKLIGVVIGLVFMTITSPGWLLYGFFTTEWLIKDSSNNNGLYSTTTVDLTQREYYGLYMKCYQGNCEDYSKCLRHTLHDAINLPYPLKYPKYT